MKANRGISCFPLEMFIKQDSHDKNCVFMPLLIQCKYLWMLGNDSLLSCDLTSKKWMWGGIGFWPKWFIYQYLCISSTKTRKLARQLLLMMICVRLKKSAISFIETSDFFHRYLYSIGQPSKIWESSYCSQKKNSNNIGFRLLIINLSHSKLSEIQNN